MCLVGSTAISGRLPELCGTLSVLLKNITIFIIIANNFYAYLCTFRIIIAGYMTNYDYCDRDRSVQYDLPVRD